MLAIRVSRGGPIERGDCGDLAVAPVDVEREVVELHSCNGVIAVQDKRK